MKQTERTLPPKVHQKGNAFYFVDTVAGKRKWIPIKSPEDAYSPSGAGITRKYREWLTSKKCGDILGRLKSRAKKKGMEFAISQNDLMEMLERSAGLCEVSVPLVFGTIRNPEEAPWTPSIDRVDCSKGYTVDNCRIVCYAANVAMSNWGEDVLHKLAFSMARIGRKNRQNVEVSQNVVDDQSQDIDIKGEKIVLDCGIQRAPNDTQRDE